MRAFVRPEGPMPYAARERAISILRSAGVAANKIELLIDRSANYRLRSPAEYTK